MTFPLMFENPILTKELRTRMRGAKAFWILLTYLGLLSVILGGTYFAWWRNQNDNLGITSTASYEMGRLFYAVIFAVQAALVGLITPALTAGALSIEREQRTFEALAVSPLSRRSIVLGKLTSAVAFVGLMLIASLPLVALCFLLGGVSPQEVATAYVLLLASAFLYGATGIAYSSFAKTTSVATVLTYGTIIVFFLGTLPLSLAGVNFMTAGLNSYVQPFLLAVNPVGAMLAGGITEKYYGVAVPSWLTALSVNLLLGTILTVVALHRIEYPRSDRSPLLRSLTAAFVSLIALYAFGHDAWSWFYLIPLYVVVFVPLFVAAERLPSGSILRNLIRLKDGNPVSGLGFVALSLVPVVLLAKVGMPDTSNEVYVRLWQTAGITLSALFGFGMLTLVLSQKLKNRWGVMALAFAIVAVVYFLPFGAEVANNQKPTVLINVLYLSPIASAAGAGFGYRLGSDGDALTWGTAALPWINIGFTSLLGLISLGLLKRRNVAGE